MGSSNDLPTRVKYILPDEEMELNGFWVLGCWVCCVKNSEKIHSCCQKESELKLRVDVLKLKAVFIRFLCSCFT